MTTSRGIINSIYRDAKSASASDFKYTFKTLLDRVYQFEIVSVQIPFTYYVLNAFTNKLVFTPDDITFYSAEVPVGNYTIGTFPAALASAMTTADGTASYTCVYSTLTGTITITRSAGTFRLINDASTINRIIGLTADSAMANPITTGVINLSGPNYLTIKSKILTQYIAVPNTTAAVLDQSDILYTVPVNTGPTGIIITPGDQLTILNKNCDFQTIDIQLEDDSGNLLDLNGSNWSMQIRFGVKK